jgi:hypothetical protein
VSATVNKRTVSVSPKSNVVVPASNSV